MLENDNTYITEKHAVLSYKKLDGKKIKIKIKINEQRHMTSVFCLEDLFLI